MKKYLLLLLAVPILFFQCKKDNTIQSKKEMLIGQWKIKSQTDSLPGGPAGYLDYSQSLLHKMNFSADSMYSTGIVTATWILQPYRGVTSYTLDGDLIHLGDSVFFNGTYQYLTLPKTFKIISITSGLMILQHIYPASASSDMFTIDSLIR